MQKTHAQTERGPNRLSSARQLLLGLEYVALHWHDLRHEYASRLVEKGVPLAQVRDLLGHASITTTERYDNQKIVNLQAAAAKLESGKTFDAPPRASVSRRIANFLSRIWLLAMLKEAQIKSRISKLTLLMIGT